MFMKSRLIVMIGILLSFAQGGRCERIKDIVDIQGVRGNPLSGVGLVIGLTNTGDSSQPSRQMLTNILRDSGLVVSPKDLTGGNIALVMVTAELGPFAREGSRIDIDVSAIGDAKSLQGGMLLPTPLKGLDDQVYAIGQGGISLGGWSASGSEATISKNHQTVGRVTGGATVEKAEIATFIEQIADQKFITLALRNNDFTTAQRIGKIINNSHKDIATVIDSGTIRVSIPKEIDQKDIAGFIDEITLFDVTVDVPAVVVVNERTGTIVVGENVGISAVAISQGSLVVKVKETAAVSQPTAPFSNGTTEKVPDTIIGVEEKGGYLIPVDHAVTVADLAKTLNAIGATPRDLIAIFNALKKAGALQARLEIM
jgi:flagellar P-ring protein precursor FlgI